MRLREFDVDRAEELMKSMQAWLDAKPTAGTGASSVPSVDRQWFRDWVARNRAVPLPT